MRQRSSRPDASPHASLARWRRYAPDGRRLLVLFSCFGVLAGLSVAVRPHLRAAASSPCHPGEVYVERVIGGWKQTPFQNPFGLCLREQDIRNDLVREPDWREQLIAFFRTPEARAAGGATYYVATTGNDSRSCGEAQNPSTPKQTINQGVRCLSAGDTLLIRGGTYGGTDININYNLSGTSWDNLVTIKGYPGETVVLSSPGKDCCLGGSGAHSYISFEDMILDGVNRTAWGGVGFGDIPAHHIRIKNLEIKNACCHGFIGPIDYMEIINVDVHDVGTNSDTGGHGIYAGGDNVLVEGSRFHRMTGYGIQLRSPGYSSNNWVIRNNMIYDNGNAGIVLVTGGNQLVYNNLIYGNNGGILMFAASHKIYNNTIVNNNKLGSNSGIIFNSGDSSSVEVKNNIIYGNGGVFADETGGTPIQANNLTTDPRFVNPAAFDFHLQPDSPAIDAGLTLAEVTTDFDGTPRPQGNGYDIGAYEFKVGGTLRGDLNGDGKRDLADVRLIIYMLIGQQAKTPEADLTGDGAVTLADVQALIRLIVGIP